MTVKKPALFLFSTLAASVALGLPAGSADSRERQAIDPSVVRDVVVGESGGAAPMAGVARGRTRSTGLRFPKKPRVLWRTRVEGPVRHEPVVDDKGRVVVAHGRGRLSQLDAKGKITWTERLGDAMTATGPVLLSDGTRAVLEHDNTLLRLAPDGQILSRHKTLLSGAALPPLPTHDGGLALAAGRRALRVSHLGEPVAEGNLQSPVVGILGQGGAVFLLSKDGSVHRFFASGRLQRLGSLGREVVGDAALADNLIVAIVAGNTLATFHLTTRVSEIRFRAPRGTDLAGWLVVGPAAKRTFVATSNHTVLGLDPDGNEDFRVSLSAGPGVAARAQVVDIRNVAPALLDANGTLGVMTPGWYTLLFDAEGQRQEIKDGNCLSPVAMTPYADHKLLTTCRAGELWLLGES